MWLELVLFGVLCVCGGGEFPPGHLKPLGSHREPELVASLPAMPSSHDFYFGYAETSTPVLLEGLLNSTQLLQNWGSDEYASQLPPMQIQQQRVCCLFCSTGTFESILAEKR